jgi:hypothetical protein
MPSPEKYWKLAKIFRYGIKMFTAYVALKRACQQIRSVFGKTYFSSIWFLGIFERKIDLGNRRHLSECFRRNQGYEFQQFAGLFERMVVAIEK